ncbi:MAG: chromosome segregation protein SMC [Saprospiraceae bacterium]|nr:chromosome segregation protein SMC [Candidatus Vicinibacter proximus]
MRLKKIEVKGFKSFADETVIHFNEAVTGIVGPNGSGKSNIVDAIRWVLGEQKGRELRLEQMSDVIFNGTKKRKEAPLAHVSLTFENTKNLLPVEYHTVNISRFLYRSGESEYRLNNVTCRLKDITSLFMDTGIGSDSYAIIALGMVEDILSNKESARRKMFEQAAGISKYKSRKRESINKLKATTEDLARIEDLLFEINNNLVELEKQAKRAKKFFEMRDKYRNSGLRLAFLSVVSLKEKIQNTSKIIDEQVIKLQEQEVKLHQSEAELEQFKKSHLDKEKSLSEYQKKVNELLDQIRGIETEIQVKDQKKFFNVTQQEALKQSNSEAGTKLEVIAQDILLLHSEIEKTQNEFNKLHLQTTELQSDYESKQLKFDELKSGVDQYQIQKEAIEKSVFELEKDLAIKRNQLENLQADSKRNADELAFRTEEFSHFNKDIKDLESNLQSVQEKIALLNKQEEDRKAKLSILQTEIETHTQSVAAANRKKDARKNEYDLLKSMVEKLEGFPESIKFLHQNWRKDVPVLTDLIYTEEKYRSAIESFLEPYLNYHVVSNEDEAIQAIRLLHGNAKGKANFFILSKFKNEKIVPADIPGFKSAISLIESDALYQPLLFSLLNNVYVKDAESYLEDVMDFPEDVTVISLSGSIIRQKNSISGGSVGLFEGKKLGRKKHLEKLELDLKTIELEVLELDRTLSQLKHDYKQVELINKEGELNAARKEESSLLQSLAQMSTKVQHFNDLKKQFEERIAGNDIKYNEIQHQRENNQAKVEALKVELNQLLNSITQTDLVFNTISTELTSAATLYNQSRLEVLKWENKLDNIKKDLEYRQRQHDETKQQLELNSKRLQDYQVELEELEKGLAEDKNQLVERFEYRKTIESDLTHLEQDYYEIRNTITGQETQIRSYQKAILEYQSSINTLKDQRSESNYKIQSTVERAELEFNTPLDKYVPEEEVEQMDEDALRDRVMYYKVRLDNYGEINPMALEAYEEMKGRYERIQLQKEDILKAQDSLLQTIKEIEETATASFMNAFNQVRVHFQDVFRSLFTSDDDCDLVLLDEMDPLECDIDIIAKPKGKRPKSIHQLSGGEKTLTAIALLFSLYLLKPAPFCIFDEVDAPLDDINIDKFNHIIRKFSKDSQFVIITHNKLTMAEVDVLYGVYMEEMGVSNVTAVDFRNYDHDIVLSEMEG